MATESDKLNVGAVATLGAILVIVLVVGSVTHRRARTADLLTARAGPRGHRR